MAPALRMTRSIKEKLPIFLGFVFKFPTCIYFLKKLSNYLKTVRLALAVYCLFLSSFFSISLSWFPKDSIHFFPLDVRVISLIDHVLSYRAASHHPDDLHQLLPNTARITVVIIFIFIFITIFTLTSQ